MRLLVVALAVLTVAIQWPLWLGRGGWVQAWQLQTDLERRRVANVELEGRNAALAAEVQSLRDGREAIEEQARMRLNMIRGDETFFQFVPPAAVSAPKATP
jgi:cell division protein FtsB